MENRHPKLILLTEKFSEARQIKKHLKVSGFGADLAGEERSAVLGLELVKYVMPDIVLLSETLSSVDVTEFCSMLLREKPEMFFLRFLLILC